MRTREEIEKIYKDGETRISYDRIVYQERLKEYTLEVLLDIRDELIKTNEPIISGKNIHEHLKTKFAISTYHMGICDVCGKEKPITEARDFFYPDFDLLIQKK